MEKVRRENQSPGGEVLEGFICPICIADLRSPSLLTRHFEEFHSEDPEILRSLKDLFGKAKKKILKQEDVMPVAQIPVMERWQSGDIDWGIQEIGETRSHTRYFREVRNTRLERYSSETNKLLIRLDKLLCNLPNDPMDRKAYEKGIVPWIEEKDVKLCPTCAKSFHVARRKHHCRLCGAVMCHTCTVFLSLRDARKMTSPVPIQDDSALTPGREERPPIGERLVLGLTKLARSPSSGSLNSMMSLVNEAANSEQDFRVCRHCAMLLEARERAKARQVERPIVCQLYERMRRNMDEASQHTKMYNKMWESLKEGESTYELEDAQALRSKIAKAGENIDILSKKILLLSHQEQNQLQNEKRENQQRQNEREAVEKGAEDRRKPLEQEERLHQMIRASAVIYLKEELLSVQALPTEEEYAKMREERQRRIEARIAYEQQTEEREREKINREQRRRENTWAVENTQLNSRGRSNQPQMILDQSQGWGALSVTTVQSSSMEPMIEQMINLQAYIQQAKADCKYDEVATLERNLEELRREYDSIVQSSGNSADTNE